MKKRSWFRAVITLVLLCIVLAPFVGHADVGGGVDWDANDWGGDFGGNDYGGYDFGGYDDDDDDYSMNSVDPFFLYFLFRNPWMALIIIPLWYFNSRSSRKNRKRQSGKSNPPSSTWVKPKEEVNLDALFERDPNFSKPEFLLRASDVFIALQQAWTAKDWRGIRVFESNSLYDQHARQLQVYIDKGQTNVVEDISILNTVLESYEEDRENSYLSVILEARYRDYVIEDESGRVIKGDKKSRYIMTYRMQFMRSLEAKTEKSSDTKVTQCPNCGASLSISQNGICEYCGAEVTTGANQWVLTALQPLQQRRS
ncbi:TIM44-like domain-containing protein [Murdochiella sp. Marseille-P8839]|nr:TIM44-like domain-containing protein [Murdochiella sp. Marseille-P8839]